ncbi:hypothetical protein MTBLM5_30046 [Magnetospirillum sp. LM-5]|nr:hypothetical protein MTBLM5_30046 [Magnetospirillum sp. LM-5]
MKQVRANAGNVEVRNAGLEHLVLEYTESKLSRTSKANRSIANSEELRHILLDRILDIPEAL